ncbi:Rossmann-like and DUF2520 domain-containing protein [Flavobacterium selenitireducens]|uniref:Rossmann-like and DUF2520 domain-containing protein n=1 Tax=Flavobacterium selenitireducens TaxID=2722704 RepID=UPI00168B2186|nr:Rossmann-like and DUF2520 domain-containing protein [Flavobacterium selenitireducens]MBD3581092.1 DUF2520 domain-containing protein [Flavobacterium selenitireducens]
MIKICIIGFGNVGRHLASAFERSPLVDLVQVFSRSGNAAPFPFSDRVISKFDDLKDADLYIVAVSDAAVESVSETLPFSGKLVVHTSGSLPMEILDGRNRKGVFYPLQTFSKNKDIDFSPVPICLESEIAADYEILEKVASALSGDIYKISFEQRRALHVSAVFASNFTNHMYKLASDICAQHDMPFAILKPLIAETAKKIETLSPEEAQTGPAIRDDQNTIDAHLELLSDIHQKNLYQIITSSIQNERKKL